MRATLQDKHPNDTSQRPCDGCTQPQPLWALVASQPGEPGEWICGHCVTDATREAVQAHEEATAIPSSSWDSERGKVIKTERNRLLDTWRWTIMPDSPLSAVCQGQFQAYLRALQRMTVDTSNTVKWKWPTPPQLEYPAAVSASISLNIK